MNERLSDRVRSALEGADAYAADLRHARVLPEHVVVALMADRDGAVARVVRELGSAPEQIEQRLHRDITKRARPGGSPTRGAELERMLDDATRQARRDKDDVVRTTHLLSRSLTARPASRATRRARRHHPQRGPPGPRRR